MYSSISARSDSEIVDMVGFHFQLCTDLQLLLIHIIDFQYI